jgi:hypothetical protein
MMYWIFAWNDGRAQGGMNDWVAGYTDRARTMDHFDHIVQQGSYDRVVVIEFVGASWKRLGGFTGGRVIERG